ncbi:MAG: TonB-dependent receptor [Ignavibacteria bacterium]|jgi:hypothetical protein
MLRKIFYFLLFVALVPTLMAATKGRIKGTVVDLQTGEPLIGANVIVVGSSIGAATDANGDFVLLNLEAGVYDVRASYLGYQTITLTDVRVNADLTTYVTFELPDEEVTVGTVEIVAGRPLIKKDATNATRITTSEDIEALPVRGVNNIIALTAGVVFQDNVIFVRGGRPDEVGYYLEGLKINNAFTGQRGVTLNQDVLEEIQVQSGGYTAEFGGANAGLVRQQLKSGGPSFKASVEYITDNIGFKSSDDFFDGEKTLGAYTWGYEELSASIGGPLFSDNIKYFVNFNNTFQRDGNPQPWPGIDLGVVEGQTGDQLDLTVTAGPRKKNMRNTYTLTNTLSFDFKPFLLRITGIYTDTRRDGTALSVFNAFNPRGSNRDETDANFTAKLTHVISPSVYYEVGAGYFMQDSERYDPWLKEDYWSYGDSVANANAGWIWTRSENDQTGRYYAPQDLDILGFGFSQPGDIDANYAKFDRKRISFFGSLSLLVGKIHSIKIGGEFEQNTLRGWSTSTLQTNYAQLLSSGTSKESILTVSSGVNNYGYDIYGNEYDGDGFYASREPVFASAYIQDRIELEDLILNLGLRYDYIDIDNLELTDPTRPEVGVAPNTLKLIEEGWQEVPSFNSVSPRIGLSFPVTDKTVFHAQYGKFVQQTRLQDAIDGYHRLAWEWNGGFHISQPSGNNIRPTRTTQYELGFTQQLTDYMSFDITGYYKDIKGNVVYILQETVPGSPFNDYATLTNGDFSTIKGVEISVNMRRHQRIAFNGSISFQDAQGTGSNPYANAGIVGAPIEGNIFVPQYVAPLTFNKAVTGNFSVDYRFGPDDGPLPLHDFGVSVLGKFDSGHPYTLGEGQDLQAETDARFRRALEPLNSSSTPSTFQLDLRIDKSFNILDDLSANIYLQVINLLDAENIQNVFLRTGSADDDGYISDPQILEGLVEQYGDIYIDVYNAIQIDYQEGLGVFNDGTAFNTTGFLYGPPRQIRLGFRLEY